MTDIAHQRVTIRRPHIVLCEGVDAQYFLIRWLGHCVKDNPSLDDLQVLDFGGIRQLTGFLKTLFNIAGFERVKSITVIRDAEDHAVGAAQSIATSFRQAGLSAPEQACAPSTNQGIRTGFALFPSCTQNIENGTLEDLCLAILAEDNASKLLHTVDGFLDSATEERGISLKRRHKNRLHAYFSSTDRYVSLKIGEAARANAFRWDSFQLNCLADFLMKMIRL